MIEIAKNFISGLFSLLKGLAVTLKNCLRPAVTLQYPAERQPMKERFRGLVDLRPEKCIACSMCVKICPTACLHLETKAVEKKRVPEIFRYKMEQCSFCGLCEQACPTNAIYMNKLYEIAVYDRNKLYINLLEPGKYAEWTNTNIK